MIFNKISQLKETSEKNRSWTLLEETLSGTINNKYSSETPRSQSLGSCFTTRDTEFHRIRMLLQPGDLKLRILWDPLEVADSQK